jgi:hypothetical protein
MFAVGQTVIYTFYGKQETARILRLGDGGILFLDNGRWMHAISCTIVESAK